MRLPPIILVYFRRLVTNTPYRQFFGPPSASYHYKLFQFSFNVLYWGRGRGRGVSKVNIMNARGGGGGL